MLSSKKVIPIIAASMLLGCVTPLLDPVVPHVFAAEQKYQTELNTLTKKYADFLRLQETNVKNIEKLSDPELIYNAYLKAQEQTTEFLENNSDLLVGVSTEIQEIDELLYYTVDALDWIYIAQLDYLNGDITEQEVEEEIAYYTESIKELDLEVYNKLMSYRTKFAITLNKDVSFLLGWDETKTIKPYTVKNGDTLPKIASTFGMTLTEIREMNRLNSDQVNVGKVLNVYEKQNVTTYIVKKGDTLYKIAKNFNTTVTQLKSLNGLKSDNISIGQVLKVTGVQTITPSPIQNAPGTYVVIKNDTLYSIAKKHNMSVAELKLLNKLTSDSIKPGLVLKVKVTSTDYIVKKGDTLYSISKKHNVTVAKIKQLNGLQADALKIGQILKLK